MKTKLLFSLAIVLLITNLGFGQKVWVGTTTDWATAGNWSPVGEPSSTDAVTIGSVPNYPIINGNVTCGNITFGGTSSSSLTVNGTLNAGAILMRSSGDTQRITNIRGTGTITCASVTVGESVTPTAVVPTTVNSEIATFNINGNLNILSRLSGSFTNNATFNFNSGTINLSGQITTSGNGTTTSPISTFIMTSGGTLNLSYGNDAVPLETPLNAGSNVNTVIALNSGSVNYNRSAGNGNQGIIKPMNGASTAYNNLNLNGSGIKYFPATQIYINNRLGISTGVKADLNTLINPAHSARHLTLPPFNQVPNGTYGSSVSTATYIDNTYFTAVAGILTKREVVACPAIPTARIVTGNGSSSCSNASIPNSIIGLGTSEADVTYQLLRGATVVETKASTGTGGVTFAAVKTPGVYTVTARLTNIYCPQTIVIMTGSVNITVKPNAPSAVLTPVNSKCYTPTGTITANNSIPLNFANGNYVELSPNSVTTNLLDNLTEFTVEGWVKFAPGSIIGTTHNYSFFGQDGVVEFGIVNNNIRIWTRKNSDATNNEEVLDFPLSSYPNDGNWHHLAATGKVTDKLTLYVDGYAVMSASSNPISGNYGATNRAARIGAGVISTIANPVTDGLTGSVHKVGFWNKALDASAIATLSNGFTNYNNNANLLAGYNFFGNNSTSLASSGSIPNTASFKNNASVTNGTGIPVYVDPHTYAWSGPHAFTATTKNLSSLAPGSYTLTTTLDGCSGTVQTVTVGYDVTNTRTWNGFTWGPFAPTADDALVFNGSYSENVDLSGCSCTVNSGIVIIKSEKTMTIVNQVVVAGGTLTFEDKSSLVQINNTPAIANSGSINYIRKTNVKKSDYTFWSTPVTGTMKMNEFSPNTISQGFQKNTNGAWAFVSGAEIMDRGIGFAIMAPNEFTESGAEFTGTFTGVPNNGAFSVSRPGQWKLVGNPYPSAINADEFILANQTLYGTVYFWTHSTPPSEDNVNHPDNPYYKFRYSSNDYASYNLTGGISTDPGGTTTMDGNIAAGQSFFIAGRTNDPIVFTNEMREGGTSNIEFYKTAKIKKAEKNRLWLKLTNEEGLFKQILIGYIDGATNNYDRLYDGVSFNNNPYANFYSLNNNSYLTIQGRALPFETTDEIPLGFIVNLKKETNVQNKFTISIDHADGSLENQKVYLYDKVTDITYDLRKGGYEFNSPDGTFNDRFVLKYTNPALEIEDVDEEIGNMTVAVKNQVITIDAKSEKIKKVIMYDIYGRTIYKNDEIDNSVLSVSNLTAGNQLLIVKIILDSGVVRSNKLLYQ